jgi:AraC-like DNA-binding protein
MAKTRTDEKVYPDEKVYSDEKVYPIVKIAQVVDALKETGVPPVESLRGSCISEDQLYCAASRVSLDQVVEVYRNAVRLAPDARFAYQTGLRFHISTYNMYGFALLSSTDFRRTMQLAMQYHQLATPLAEIGFKEIKGKGVWTIDPLPHPAVDSGLYRFIVEIQFGHMVSMHRDFMGAAFAPSELHVTFGKPSAVEAYVEPLSCKMFFAQAKNRLVFDACWLNTPATLGNSITNHTVIAMCDALLEELELRSGLAGRVRDVLLSSIGHDTSLASVSERLKIPQRTLRRRLREEGTSFREIAEHLRMQLAIKYLRDTDLTVEDIAFALGFSDAANFRHSFHRWTGKSPNQSRTGFDNRSPPPTGAARTTYVNSAED